MAETTPVEEKNTITNEQRLELLLVNERIARLDAQAANLQLQFNNTQMALTKAREDATAFANKLRAEYNLQPKDEIDPATGAITRAK